MPPRCCSGRAIRQKLQAATATGVDEAERLVHGAIVGGIESGLVQGLEAALSRPGSTRREADLARGHRRDSG
jgi:hypothetical protein